MKPTPKRFRATARPDLTFPQILAWADAFFEHNKRWPTRKDGSRGLLNTTWSAVNACLQGGHRGLPPGSSLAKLLLKYRGRRHHNYLPALTSEQILLWADTFHARTGDWPQKTSGPVTGAPGETWLGIDCSLHDGRRGLPGGSSLAQLLAAERGVRNHQDLAPLSTQQIVDWARSHHTRTGEWPKQTSGDILDAPGETWAAVNGSLAAGVRGLPGGSSLAQLLQSECGVPNPAAKPLLKCHDILVWADSHHQRTGQWPTAKAGSIPESTDESWSAIDSALWSGTRGLPGGDSLARFLARKRKKRNRADLAPLTVEQLLAWADAHHHRTGEWPNLRSGTILGAPGERWAAVNSALRNGRRGLPGGSSLPQLLEAERGVRNLGNVAALTIETVLTWADDHHRKTGTWPKITSGSVLSAPGETWSGVGTALATGSRGLPPDGSLAKLLAEHRGQRNHMTLPPFKLALILKWAEAYRTRTGEWPTRKAGLIPESPGDTWHAVESALTLGIRGLPGGDSLAKLLARARGKRNHKGLAPLRIAQIRKWVRQYKRSTGEWPQPKGGLIPGSGGETWTAVDQALCKGNRGLPGGSSLSQIVRSCQKAKSS